jgi:hypothetical protein
MIVYKSEIFGKED